MTLATGNPALDTLSNELLRRLIDVQRQDGADKASKRSIRETAFHDFAAYRLLMDPVVIHFGGEDGGGKPVDLDAWADFDAFLSDFPQEIEAIVTHMLFEMETVIGVDGGSGVVFADPASTEVLETMEAYLAPAVARFASAFRATMGMVLFRLFRDAADKPAFREKARRAVNAWLLAKLTAMRAPAGSIAYEDFRTLETAGFWLAGISSVVNAIGSFARVPRQDDGDAPFGEKLPPAYNFTPFAPETVNIGFRQVYRQTWVPLGTQAGEVVRTLPLGPRQSEKIGIKLVNTSRTKRSSESSRSLETSTEASLTGRDSSEIVNEASSKLNWNASAGVTDPISIFSGVKVETGGELALSSRETKSRLNETMKKTASKLRSDTKIVVSLEREQTDERSQYSEIVNPNDEIAVTYVYSRLQRQYEIETFLASVDAVLYVAERVPAPKEVTGHWIRRHDWIIADALLDDSFRDDLEVVRNHEYSSAGIEPVDGRIDELMGWLSNEGIPDYSGVAGKIPDLFQNAQQAYEREVERRRARLAENERYRRSVRRLRAHLYDNILHYCRAIWSAEDPNARYLRYRAIRVPVRWEFIATDRPAGVTIEGQFAPAIEDRARDTAMLADLVDLSGPIGYCGNYAVYRLRTSAEWPDLTGMIDLARMPFMRIAVTARHEDEKRRAAFDCFAAASAGRQEGRRYRLTYAAGAEPHFLLQAEQAANVFAEVDRIAYREGQPVEFQAIRVWITPRTDGNGAGESLKDGDTFLVTVRLLPVLEDPERRQIKWSTGPLRAEDEDAFFTTETIQAFADYFADCAAVLARAAKERTGWSDIDAVGRAIFIGRYFDYLIKIRHTQRLLVDSNDLILTREVDTSSSLEPFKSLHRYIDALSAFEDMNAKSLENRRLDARLRDNLLGDPNVDRVTVVSSSIETGIVAAVDGGDGI